MSPSIAIIGAGPAGLTLTRLLQVGNVDLNLTVFEKDASPTARVYQGGTLDLHPETGLAALKKAELFDEFQKHARYEGEEMVISDKNGVELLHTKEASDVGMHARPEIDRETLKDMLLASVDSKLIQWDKNLKSIDAENGVLTFGDGSTAGPFDLVVGCDGAWSKVRPVLTDVTPHYAGICGFECHIIEPTQRHPELSKMVGRGSYFAFSDSKAMIAQRTGDDSIKVSCWLMKEADYPEKMIGEHGVLGSNLKEEILSNYSDWLPEMQEWVRVSTKFRSWPLYELPVGHSWTHKKGYTVISDAASLMTPFAGEGVNKGMRDALDLSEAIITCVKEGGDLDTAIKTFEEEMFPRAKRVQDETMTNKIYMFKTDAPVGFMVKMMEVMSGHD